MDFQEALFDRERGLDAALACVITRGDGDAVNAVLRASHLSASGLPVGMFLGRANTAALQSDEWDLGRREALLDQLLRANASFAGAAVAEAVVIYREAIDRFRSAVRVDTGPIDLPPPT